MRSSQLAPNGAITLPIESGSIPGQLNEQELGSPEGRPVSHCCYMDGWASLLAGILIPSARSRTLSGSASIVEFRYPAKRSKLISRSSINFLRSYGHKDSWFCLPTLYVCINIVSVNISLYD